MLAAQTPPKKQVEMKIQLGQISFRLQLQLWPCMCKRYTPFHTLSFKKHTNSYTAIRRHCTFWNMPYHQRHVSVLYNKPKQRRTKLNIIIICRKNVDFINNSRCLINKWNFWSVKNDLQRWCYWEISSVWVIFPF